MEPAFKNSRLPVEQRVESLLSQMTFEEKVAQLWAFTGKRREIVDENGLNESKMSDFLPHGLGMYGWPQNVKQDGGGFHPLPLEEMVAGKPSAIGARGVAEITNRMQKYFVERTRLGIPVIFHVEALHGIGIHDGLSLPQSIALASSWNTDLMRSLFAAVALEGRKAGISHVLSPVLDVCREPRWGRIEETYGEDPHLVKEMSLAAVQGFQGCGERIDSSHLAATLKHFLAYGASDGGRNLNPVNLGERALREIFLPPFEACVKKAKAATLMPSYNEIDGVPSHASRWLLTEILRKEWGFRGCVVADYAGISHLYGFRRIAHDKKEAAYLAFRAGVDIELPNSDCYLHLPELVREGKISISEIDEAVRRVLRLKSILGLFEHPYVDPDEAARVSNCPEHVALALKAVHESVVLLKNDGETLPLDRKNLRRIAVIGPNAAEGHIGGYGGWPRYVVDPLSGIRKKAGSQIEVVYAEGCRINELSEQGRATPADESENRKLISEAAELASTSDLAILALGENEKICGEGLDSESLELPGMQQELFDTIHATGKRTVVLLINGRPLGIRSIAENASAILECWYQGQEGGNGIADILFGDVNPSGKLPVSIPSHVGTLPVHYNQKARSMNNYVFMPATPLYPFGHGLSYTEFSYGEMRVKKRCVARGETVNVSVDVANTGTRRGADIVQLYIRDEVSSVTRPEKELKAFKKIDLEPGECRRVDFELDESAFWMWDVNMKRVVEPGIFTVMIGPSSAITKETTIEVV